MNDSGEQQDDPGGAAGSWPDRPDDPKSSEHADYSGMLGRCASAPGGEMRCADSSAAILHAPDPAVRYTSLEQQEAQEKRDQIEDSIEVLKFIACDGPEALAALLGAAGVNLCSALKVADDFAKIQPTASREFDQVPWVQQSSRSQPPSQTCHINPELDPVDKGNWSKTYRYKP